MKEFMFFIRKQCRSEAALTPDRHHNPHTRIEVRPFTMKEETTGFVYPKS
jgi:hypothetical protein